MSLCSDPPACVIAASGGTAIHRLHNGSFDRMCFKVKSSNNNEYRITPVFGFVLPLSHTDIIVNRVAGPAGTDKLMIQYVVAHGTGNDPQIAFSIDPPIGQLAIPLTALTAEEEKDLEKEKAKEKG